MDEFTNEEINELLNAIQTFANIDDSVLTDEVTARTMADLQKQFSTQLVQSSITQIVQGFENSQVTREEATNTMQALKQVIHDDILNVTEFSGNKRQLIDYIANTLDYIFDTAADMYHSYAITLPIKLDSGAQMPTYAHDTDAAADLYAADTTTLAPHSFGNMIRTGVHIQLPEGWVAYIVPRSSIGMKTSLRQSNSIGVIDSSYRGQLGILYDNIGDEPFTVNAGDRMAQLIVMPSYRFKAKKVDILNNTDRGEGGFGSTGV